MQFKMTTRIVREKHACGKSVTISIKPTFADKTYRCVYCTLLIHGIPIGCPVNRVKRVVQDGKHCENVGMDEFNTIGVFCSYSCVKAFIRANSHDPTYSKSTSYLAEMYAIDYNVKGPITITPSPSPLLMAEYGGFMSEEQYKAEKGKIEYVSNGHTIMHPMTSLFNKIE